METRRSFIAKSAASLAALALPLEELQARRQSHPPMKTRAPKKALVVWYSQTGHTRRIARLLTRTWQRQGIDADARDYRAVDPTTLPAYDLVAVGTPVYYLDVPGNVRQWLAALPAITGTPVAAFVTFGGKGDNQHNTACALLELLAAKGGVPAGMALFGNMSTFAPTWSMGNESRTLKYRHLPNGETYGRARRFADEIVKTVAGGSPIPIVTHAEAAQLFRHFPQIGFTKMMIGTHRVDRERCIDCGTCVEACPVGAIHPDRGTVEHKKCILCLGCVNNCPTGAVTMTFMGKRVYRFEELLRRHGITIEEPEELRE